MSDKNKNTVDDLKLLFQIIEMIKATSDSKAAIREAVKSFLEVEGQNLPESVHKGLKAFLENYEEPSSDKSLPFDDWKKLDKPEKSTPKDSGKSPWLPPYYPWPYAPYKPYTTPYTVPPEDQLTPLPIDWLRVGSPNPMYPRIWCAVDSV